VNKLSVEEVPIKLGNEVDVFEERGILRTGDERLDDFLNLQRGIPIMIAGEAYTGKTTLAMSISLETLSRGGRVFYVDSEHGVLGKRIAQMCSARGIELNLVKRRMRVLRVNRLSGLSKYLRYASTKYDLIVVDSISRLVINDSRASTSNLKSLENSVTRAYNILSESVTRLVERNGSLIVINEVIPRTESKDVFHTLKLSLDKLTVLTKIIVCMTMKRGRRLLYLERHPFKPSIYEEPLFIEYKITNKGVEYISRVQVEKGMIHYYVDVY